MKKEDRDLVTLLVLQYLNLYTDEQNPCSLADIQLYLEEHDIHVDRRVCYRVFNALEDSHYPLVRIHRNKAFTYYLDHAFSSGETFILLDAIYGNKSLSDEDKKAISYKLEKLLSVNQKTILPRQYFISEKLHAENVVEHISDILQAIKQVRTIQFYYYDYDLNFLKQYRHNHNRYSLLPLHVYGNNQRYYCVGWASESQRILNFRIDKMEDVQVGEISDETVHFDLESYMRNTFHGFTGDSETVTIVFDMDMVSLVFDQFSNQIIISEVYEDSFQANIKTAITPTFIAWLLQFNNRFIIQKPQSLIDQICDIAQNIQDTYKGANK